MPRGSIHPVRSWPEPPEVYTRLVIHNWGVTIRARLLFTSTVTLVFLPLGSWIRRRGGQT